MTGPAHFFLELNEKMEDWYRERRGKKESLQPGDLPRENEDPDNRQSLYGMKPCLIGHSLFAGRGRG